MNARTIAYWTTTSIVALGFAAGGLFDLLQSPQVVETMAHLGYPAYFASLLGAWKVLGAIAILAPGAARLKEWAYAGATFALTMALISAIASNEPAQVWILPPVLLVLLFVSYVTRPASRRTGTPRAGL